MAKILQQLHVFLWSERFIHFLITGASGALLNLFVTWSFTRFVFGLNNYLYAYFIGVGVNFLFNFALHTTVTFRTKKDHFRRLVFFVIYSAIYILILTILVKTITTIVGVQYYLLVIASLILLFSLVNFTVFKHSLFRE